MDKVAAILLILCLAACTNQPRSRAQRDDFARYNPCPATGKTAGSCPGYVVDHIIPLCAGGPDKPSNMQWQELEASKIKDQEERRQCKK